MREEKKTKEWISYLRVKTNEYKYNEIDRRLKEQFKMELLMKI